MPRGTRDAASPSQKNTNRKSLCTRTFVKETCHAAEKETDLVTGASLQETLRHQSKERRNSNEPALLENWPRKAPALLSVITGTAKIVQGNCSVTGAHCSYLKVTLYSTASKCTTQQRKNMLFRTADAPVRAKPSLHLDAKKHNTTERQRRSSPFHTDRRQKQNPRRIPIHTAQQDTGSSRHERYGTQAW